MKTNKENFSQIVNIAMLEGTTSHMRAVIEKELLHYDILFALERDGFLDKLVFQGGTSLRLCYGGNRFSEGLDFAGGVDFSSKVLVEIKTCLEKYIGERYGLEVYIKEPKQLREDPKYAEIRVDKWQIAVVTSPERKDLPKQKIKLEIANIPSYTKEPLPLQVKYDFLPDGYGDTLIMVETLNEVMADKIISLPATQKYVRHRDVWDLVWLQQQDAKLDMKLVKQKSLDYKLDKYLEMVESLLERIPEIVQSKPFIDEMKRFLPTDVFDRTLGQEKFKVYMTNSLNKLFTDVLKQISDGHKTPEFLM